MKFRTTAILLVVVAAAITWIASSERHGQSTREAERSADRLAAVDPAEIYEIKIEDAAGVSRIRRIDGIWNVVMPYKDRADQEFAEALIGLINRLEVRERLPSADAISGLDAFGASARTVTLKKDADTNVVLVTLGKRAGFADTLYARDLLGADPDEVLVVHAEGLGLLNRPASEFRDPRPLPFGAGEVTRLRIRNAGGEIEVARVDTSEKAQWWLTKPLNARADNVAVADKLGALASVPLTVRTDPGDGEGAAAPTFGDDAVRVTAWRSDEEEPVVIDLVPASGSDAEVALAEISDRRPTFEMPLGVIEALAVTPNDLRDTTLAAIEAEAVNTIVIRSRRDPDVVLFRNGPLWWVLRNGRAEEANAARVEGLMESLNDHPILEFTTDAAADLAPYGLDDPFLRLLFSNGAITEREGVGAFDVTAANSLSLRLGEGERNRLYANFEGEPFVYTVGPSLITEIPTRPIKWKGLRVLSFSLFDLRAITFTQGTLPPFRLTCDITRNQWQATRPGVDLTPELDRDKALDYANRLAVFVADDWVADPVEALGILESAPSLTLEVLLETEPPEGGERVPETIVLRFAPTAPGKLSRFYYGNRVGDPEVFLISRETYESLTVSLLK